MEQEPDPTMTLQAFEQILPELKKISEQKLKPEEIRAELERASKGEVVDHYLKLIEQHFEVIRAFVALAEATGKVLKTDGQTIE